MYAEIYDENQNHIANISDVVYDLTKRVYDLDNLSASGIAKNNINNARIAVICDESGNKEHAYFVDSITPDNDKRIIKGLDLRDLWNTEILLDFTQPNSFDARLSAVFGKVAFEVFQSGDAEATKISVVCHIPDDDTDTSIIADLQDSYTITNAYSFLKIYLKYYEYNIVADYDVQAKQITFDFIRQNKAIAVNLKDFNYSLTTTSTATNKAVATIDFKPTEEQQTRPPDLAIKYYYRDKDNNIIEADERGDIPDRLYPVKCKIFEAQYLAEAQLNAVYELASARFVDNIVIDANKILDPIDLTDLPLYTKVNIYHEGTLYKTLPVSEIITRVDPKGENIQIRLGFKKILFTEIVKQGGN